MPTDFADAFLQTFMQGQQAQQQQKLAAQQFMFQNMWNQQKLAQERDLDQQRIDQTGKYQGGLLQNDVARTKAATAKDVWEALTRGGTTAETMPQAAPLAGVQAQPTGGDQGPALALPPQQQTVLPAGTPVAGAVDFGNGQMVRPKTPQEHQAEQAAQQDATFAQIDKLYPDPKQAALVKQIVGLKTVAGLNPNAADLQAMGMIAPKLSEGQTPLGDTAANINEGHTRLFQQLHPGEPLPANYVLTDKSTKDDYARINGQLKDEQAAVTAKAQRDQALATHNETLRARLDDQAARRADLSYRTAVHEVDTLAKPITDMAPRIARLEDTLAQKNMQADALVAPELLSIMAGGAGSGLRMNEAEIARMVGGRTAWESLKAAAQKWSTDPTSARSITAEQDRQIRTLVDAVKKRYEPVRKTVLDAQETIANSTDPAEHKQAVLRVHRALDSLSNSGATATGAPGDPLGIR